MPLPITFTAHYGDLTKSVTISQPTGAGDIIFLTIDNFHCGQFVKYKGEWMLYGRDETIQGDDIGVLGSIIEEEMGK